MTRFIESTITFPYKRSLGPVVGAFMTALTEKQILGHPLRGRRAGPADGVGPGDRRRAAPRVRRGGSGGHRRVVDVGAGTVGAAPARPTLRLRPDPPGRGHHAAAARRRRRRRRRPCPTGCGWPPGGGAPGRAASTTSSASSPGEAPETEGEDTGAADEPVTRMDYLASITYRNPVPEAADRATEASREHRLLGLRCPVCGRVYAGGRGLCPVDAIELGPRLRGGPAPHRAPSPTSPS